MSPSSRSRKPRKTYHHGDLRRALLQGAVQQITKNGIQNLSLRDLAREIGVSHTAPYRHFVDRQSLLAAIAEAGYQELLDVTKRVVASTDDVSKQIQGMAWEYVNFVHTHPVQAHLMFSRELSDRSKFPELQEASGAAFSLAKQVIESGQRQNVIVDGPSKLLAATAWAHAHGLALLIESGRLLENIGTAAHASSLKRLTEQAVHFLFSGILNRKG